jgi:hypothetical protein
MFACCLFTYYGAIYQYDSIPENTMMSHFPMTWTALQLGLASAAAWLLCETDALSGAAVLFLH